MEALIIEADSRWMSALGQELTSGEVWRLIR
jgi:hypothetical protein